MCMRVNFILHLPGWVITGALFEGKRVHYLKGRGATKNPKLSSLADRRCLCCL